MCSLIVGEDKLVGFCQHGYESSGFINVGYSSYSGGMSVVWHDIALPTGIGNFTYENL